MATPTTRRSSSTTLILTATTENRKRELSLSPIRNTTPTNSKRAKIDTLFHTPMSDDQVSDLGVGDYWSNPPRVVEEQEEEEEEEDEEDEDIPINSLHSLGDKAFRRSLYSELLLSSNLGTEDDEVLLHSRRKSANIASHLFDDEEEEDENEEERENDQDFTTEDDKTTIPLSRPYAAKPHHYDDEIDALFSSHVDEPQTAEFVLSSSLKMAILNQQQNHTPRYHTEWPHFLTTDYFKQHGPKDRSITIPSPPTKQSSTTASTWFDSKYSILSSLGSGEFAEVWQVRELDTNQISAVKKSKSHFVGWDDRWQQLIEVDHLRCVQDSKYCVQLLNAWEERGFLYIQLELCSYGSLDQYIKYENGNIPEDIVWKIFYEIVLGIQDIHQADIVHLDLKPSNILIDDKGYIKIGDFGISVKAPVDMRWVRGEGDRRYMAPDLLREEFDKPADIFSLGLILLELATGIVLPGTGESWEMLRVGDFSKQKVALSKLSLEMSEMVEWLLTTSSRERPTIYDIISHSTFVEKVAACGEGSSLSSYVNGLNRQDRNNNTTFSNHTLEEDEIVF